MKPVMHLAQHVVRAGFLLEPDELAPRPRDPGPVMQRIDDHPANGTRHQPRSDGGQRNIQDPTHRAIVGSDSLERTLKTRTIGYARRRSAPFSDRA